MTTETLTGTPTRPAERGPVMPADADRRPALPELRQPEALGPNYVCAACFGPLEVAYDLELDRRTLDRATIAARPPGIWRYLELLPVEAAAGARVCRSAPPR